MPPSQLRNSGRAALLSGAALVALAASAFAKDAPATATGAKTISDFVATYAGKGAATSPALTVTPEGSDYAVTFDIGSINFPTTGGDIGYNPATIKMKIFQQTDGAWRIEQSEMPPLSLHQKVDGKVAETSIVMSGVQNAVIIDPAMSWVRSSQGKIDKMTLVQAGPGIDQHVEIGAVDVTGVGKASPDGVVSLSGKESVGPLSLKMTIDPKAANPKAPADSKPVNIAMQSDKFDVNVTLDGLKIKPALDLWAFLVAHPTRPELAGDEAAFKTLALAALSSQVSLGEDGATPKLTVQAQPGEFVFEGLKGSLGLASAGPASRYEQHFSVTSMRLPAGLVPPAYHDLVPTSLDFGFKISGFDVAAAGTEAIADMHLAGDAPPISKADNDKVFAKLVGSGPVTLEIPPSHVVAPQLDVSFEGKATYIKGKPNGTLTVHVHNFDKTVAALKGLGPDAEKQMVPMLAMAKGLAKTDPNDVLTWVAEIGADSIIKVNGLPLGKSPF